MLLNLSPIDPRDFSDLEPCQMGNGRDAQKPANVQGAYSAINTGKLYDKNQKRIKTSAGIAQAAGAATVGSKRTRAQSEQVRAGIAAATKQVQGGGVTRYGSTIGPAKPKNKGGRPKKKQKVAA